MRLVMSVGLPLEAVSDEVLKGIGKHYCCSEALSCVADPVASLFVRDGLSVLGGVFFVLGE